MKKIFTLAAAALFTLGASADDAATKTNVFKTLDKGLVIYLTSDTTTTKMGYVEDEDTGEEVEALVSNPWNASAMANNFTDAGIGMGTNTEDMGVKVVMKQNYQDEQTGFSINAGEYRGVTCTKSRFSLSGALDATRTFKGFKNLGSVVLYFIPVPTTWTTTPAVSLQDYPTGRVEAQYLNEDGTALSNLAYREVHIDQTADPNESETQSVKGCNLVGFEREANDNLKIKVDRPMKVTVNLKNEKDASEYEALWANAASKQGEFVDLTLSTEPEGSIDYYFGTKSEIYSYYLYKDNDPSTGTLNYKDDADLASRRGEGNGTATGYSLYDQRWATKLAWSETTPISVQVKYRMYLVGMALVSGTNPNEFQYFDGSAQNAKGIQDTNMGAYGVNVGVAPTAIQTVNASTAKVAPRKQLVNGQIVIGNYNIAGQRIK